MNDVSGSGPVSREYAVTGGQQIQLPARELPKMKQAAYDEGYGHGLEAGVQAERERIEARMKAMREETKNFTRSVTLDAALAVVTGKEGASDEG